MFVMACEVIFDITHKSPQLTTHNVLIFRIIIMLIVIRTIEYPAGILVS
jgi:hypothetical protein